MNNRYYKIDMNHLRLVNDIITAVEEESPKQITVIASEAHHGADDELAKAIVKLGYLVRAEQISRMELEEMVDETALDYVLSGQ